MAEYVDEPVELWHSRSWGSSVRAASGDFVRIPDGSIIFPGDFVEFPPLQTRLTGISFIFGRVIFTGRDQFSCLLTVLVFTGTCIAPSNGFI